MIDAKVIGEMDCRWLLLSAIALEFHFCGGRKNGRDGQGALQRRGEEEEEAREGKKVKKPKSSFNSSFLIPPLDSEGSLSLRPSLVNPHRNLKRLSKSCYCLLGASAVPVPQN